MSGRKRAEFADDEVEVERELTLGRRSVVDISLPWGVGWLFTIGYAHLGVGQALLAVVIWPYYLGAAVAA